MELSACIKSFIKGHENDDIHLLTLQAHRYPDIDIQLAIRQIAGRQIAKIKIPSWYKNEDILYPQHISMEQSSSEATANYKAQLCEDNAMTDLTGGLGVDFSFLAKRFSSATYVEQQAELAEIAKSNFNTLGLHNVKVINGNAVEYLENMQTVDLIYIDPARRSSGGQKTVFIEDCTPNLIEIENLLSVKAKRVMIKLSPMLDISLAIKSLKDISEVHVVSVNNECKELLFIKDKMNNNDTIPFYCINIKNNKTDIFSFSKEEEEKTAIEYTNSLNTYLYEPNASIIKAGAYKSIGKSFSLNKLHPSSHLYTSDNLLPEFPGRGFKIKNVFSLNKKEVKESLSNIKQANISIRNFPLSVQEIRKRTGLKDGGDLYIFATTLSDEKKVLILCEKI